jgi:Fe-S-cluster containining protein
MEKTTFYASGLKFSCKRCSSCCREASGFVYLTEKDLNNLMSALKMERDNFIAVYCRWVTDWKGDEVLSLKEKSNKDCILWDSGCAVYTARPLQCITFPFWDSVLNSKQSWDIAASGCPGMNSGKLHTQKAIDEDIELRASEPIINKTVQGIGG